MKPNFALIFASDSIGLLHRTARGWLEIGSTRIDAPDMGEALSYLRRSALGLAPHGVATKLIIPEDQILYLELEAPGPSDSQRASQIRRALEGRTPYMVEELVFDWSGDGRMVQVAVVARETLQEAEAFAAEYRLNPICFAAQPQGGQFAGEPWFGPSSLAASLLPEGEAVERDVDPVQVVSRDAHRAARIEAAAREAVSRPQAEAPPRARRKAERAQAAQEAAAEAAPVVDPAPYAAALAPVEAPPADPIAAEQDLAAVEPLNAEPTAPEISEPEIPAIAEPDTAAPEIAEAVAAESWVDPVEPRVWEDPQGVPEATPHHAAEAADWAAPAPVEDQPAVATDDYTEASWPPAPQDQAEHDDFAAVDDHPEATIDADHDPLADHIAPMAYADPPMNGAALAFENAADEPGQVEADEIEADELGADELGPEAPVWLEADETPEPPRAPSQRVTRGSQSTFDFDTPPASEAAPGFETAPEFRRSALHEPRIALPNEGEAFVPQPLGKPAQDRFAHDSAEAVELPPVFASARNARAEAAQPPPAASRPASQITARMEPAPPMAADPSVAPADEAGITGHPGEAGSSGRLAVTSVTPHRRMPSAPLTPPATAASAAEPRLYDPAPDSQGHDFADLPAEAAPHVDLSAADLDDDLPPPVAPQIRDALAASRATGAAKGLAGTSRPGAKPAPTGLVPPATPRAKSGKLGLGALVTAPGIPGFGGGGRAAKAAKAAVSPQAAAQTLVAPPPEGSAARATVAPIRGRAPLQRGKPRFLGLILTGLLLLMLAVVGAWSSITLSRNAAPPETTEQPQDVAALPQDAGNEGIVAPALDPATTDNADLADSSLPSVDDEAMADGEGAIDLAADPAASPTAPAATDGPAPATGNLLLTEPGPAEAPGQQDEIILSTMDAPPPANDAFALALPQANGDALPTAAAPPPPFGTQYEFDADGLIRPTPEGIVTPDGYLLVAGRPARVPPPRPDSIAALAAPQAADPAAAPAADATATPAIVSDPSLQGFRPRPRPEGLTGPTGQDDAALAIPPAQRMTSVHPRARPASITRMAEQQRQEEEARRAAEAASLSATAAAAAVPQGEDPTAEALAAAAAAAVVAPQAGPISPLAVAISRKPPKKPRNFDARVQAAVAAAAAPAPRSQPQAEEEPPARSTARRAEPGEDEEPEVAQTRAPKIPTTASVAKNATFANAINLKRTNLIGVYGTPSKRYALIRLGSGQYKKVRVGDRVDGGTVAAITDNEVRYKKGGRMLALSMPRG